MVNTVGKITCCNGFGAFFPPLPCIPASILPNCLKFHEAFNWTNAEQKLDHSLKEKNPALTIHCTNTELTWNCAKFQIFFSISLDFYYYYNYSAFSNIINSHKLDCSNLAVLAAASPYIHNCRLSCCRIILKSFINNNSLLNSFLSLFYAAEKAA